MVSFKISAETFRKFLEYIQSSGYDVKGDKISMFEDCIINVDSNGLNALAIEQNEIMICNVDVSLSKSDIKEEGQIPLDIKPILNSVKRFKKTDIIEVVFNGETILLRRSTPILEYEEPTIDFESVKTVSKGKLPFSFNKKENEWVSKNGTKLNTYIKVDASELTEIIKDGEQILRRSFPFAVTKKNVIVTSTNEKTGKKSKRELKTEQIKTEKDIASLYSYGFGNTFSNFDGVIEIWLANEAPLLVKKEEKEISVIYMLSTLDIIEEDEEEESTDQVDAGEINKKLKDDLEKDQPVKESTEEEVNDIEENVEVTTDDEVSTDYEVSEEEEIQEKKVSKKKSGSNVKK